jgi:ADP-ribose pyrophosphatase YjhB (NUDIX family)
MPKDCDNASVGVLIVRDGRLLMFDRNTEPVGCAPVAGHVFDAHTSYDDAARAEVAEELGLTVETLELTPVGGWRGNRCRRLPGPNGVGHQWRVYLATVSGDLKPSPRETRNARWLDPAHLQQLARWTVMHARGEISADEFAADPGIEPVWCRFLMDLGFIRLSAADLDRVETVARSNRAWPEVVCLCGSTRFHDTFRELNLQLTLEGKIVLSIECDTKSDADLLRVRDVGDTVAVKARLDELHKRKIDLAHSVLVLNVRGYIGESTRSAIDYAKGTGKRVRYLEPVW